LVRFGIPSDSFGDFLGLDLEKVVNEHVVRLMGWGAGMNGVGIGDSFGKYVELFLEYCSETFGRVCIMLLFLAGCDGQIVRILLGACYLVLGQSLDIVRLFPVSDSFLVCEVVGYFWWFFSCLFRLKS
jgi:hypothetical protein